MVDLPQPEGIERDPEIYAAVKRLALATVEAAIDVLDTGAPAQQIQMIRVVLPRLTGGLNRKTDDENDPLKKKVAEMFGRVEQALNNGGADDGRDPSET